MKAELPCDAAGRCYHLQVGAGEVAPLVLTSGSAERIRRLAESFDRVELVRQQREFLTITGSYQGIRITGLATGIGPDNTAIAVIEAVQYQPQATFIRIGSCGSLQPEIQLGDLIISTEALRHENTTQFYAPAELKAVADPLVTQALIAAAQEQGVVYHCGLTCTTSDFYHGQGRRVPGFSGCDPTLLPRLQAKGVLNLEMEMAAYFILAQVSDFPLRAGGLTAVFADRWRGTFIAPEEMSAAEDRAIQVALEAVLRLADRP